MHTEVKYTIIYLLRIVTVVVNWTYSWSYKLTIVENHEVDIQYNVKNLSYVFLNCSEISSKEKDICNFSGESAKLCVEPISKQNGHIHAFVQASHHWDESGGCGQCYLRSDAVAMGTGFLE